MTTNQHKQEITLINIFTVEPEKQQSATDKVAEIYQTFVSNQPGFISAKVQASLDGTRVAAVAQWESRSALTAMQQNSDFQNLVKILDGEIVTAEPYIYTVIDSIGS